MTGWERQECSKKVFLTISIAFFSVPSQKWKAVFHVVYCKMTGSEQLISIRVTKFLSSAKELCCYCPPSAEKLWTPSGSVGWSTFLFPEAEIILLLIYCCLGKAKLAFPFLVLPNTSEWSKFQYLKKTKKEQHPSVSSCYQGKWLLLD